MNDLLDEMIKLEGKLSGKIESAEIINEGQNGYIALFQGKKAEIYADSLYDAKLKAIEQLRVPKGKQGLLSVTLAEKDGEEVSHSTACIGEAVEDDEPKDTIELSELRALVGKKGYGIKTKRFSFGTGMTYVDKASGEENTGTVYSTESRKKWEPLFDYLKTLPYKSVMKDGKKVSGHLLNK